jgi:hypothetical protein
VSFAAHDVTEEADCHIEEFVQETGWRPGMVSIFAGTLRYTQCGFVKRYKNLPYSITCAGLPVGLCSARVVRSQEVV